jgi:hypothetical protein
MKAHLPKGAQGRMTQTEGCGFYSIFRWSTWCFVQLYPPPEIPLRTSPRPPLEWPCWPLSRSRLILIPAKRGGRPCGSSLCPTSPACASLLAPRDPTPPRANRYLLYDAPQSVLFLGLNSNSSWLRFGRPRHRNWIWRGYPIPMEVTHSLNWAISDTSKITPIILGLLGSWKMRHFTPKFSNNWWRFFGPRFHFFKTITYPVLRGRQCKQFMEDCIFGIFILLYLDSLVDVGLIFWRFER